MAHDLVITIGGNRFEFAVEPTPIADLWLERMAIRHSYNLDDPTRFYHFDSYHAERERASRMVKATIKTINQHKHIIKRRFRSVYDQDTLNYLHNIFERYHGMLDQQHHEFWHHAPEEVKTALCNLNLAVHRCEYLVQRKPEFVCTWFGMPKIKILPLDLQQEYGQLGCEFGGVYLNYVEIGKSALHLARDNDQYIADDMFKPFDRYSADFIATFYDHDTKKLTYDLDNIKSYFYQQQSFFGRHGIDDPTDIRLLPVKFKVAQLKYNPSERSAIMKAIAKKQMIQDIQIT
jgi:hypothetical protein